MGVDSSGLSLSSPLIFPVVADLPIPAPFQDLSQQLQLPQRPPAPRARPAGTAGGGAAAVGRQPAHG